MRALASRLAERAETALGEAELEQLASQLAEAIADSHRRWPGIADHDDAFVEALATRIEAEGVVGDAIARLVLPDIYLVAACVAQDRVAMGALERIVRDETTRAVGRLGRAIGVEDVVQELLVKLLVTSDGRPAKLAAYGGHGTVNAWLRVAALRTAISMTRRKQEVAVEDEALAVIADDSDDQALALIKSSYRAEFKQAFAMALAALPKRSRTLLRMQIIDQLTLEDIGTFYRVSRATTARWLADARAELVAGTQRRLVEQLQLPADELAELMRLAASNLYATLPRLLCRTQS